VSVALRPLVYSDEAFAPIMAEAEQAGGGFMLRVRDEWLSGAQRFDGPGEFLLGAWDGGLLVGVGGISRDPYDPQPGLGRVRHVYVLQALRGQGIGRALMEALLARARRDFTTLRLRTRNPEAAALYERIGFEPRTADDETHRLTLR
jgi:GNAT superfamily N-acetyltransferase